MVEVREDIQGLSPGIGGRKQSQATEGPSSTIAVYYFGDSFSSPFDLSEMSHSMQNNGVMTPNVIDIQTFIPLVKPPV